MDAFRQWYAIKNDQGRWLRFLVIDGFNDRAYFTADKMAAQRFTAKIAADYFLEEHPSILSGCRVLLVTNTKPL